jgi:lysophospholipase L1-like esterase
MKYKAQHSKDLLSRRRFFTRAGLGTAAIAAAPALINSCSIDYRVKKGISSYFSERDVVLFQGDSITDAGRDKQRQLPNDAASIGAGYIYLIAAGILEELAGKEVAVYNRGISGNKVYQLADRWQEDCLDLQPDVLSILIGVNDYWHMREGGYDGTPEIYAHDYRELLARTKEMLPDVKLVICQPFILPGTAVVDESWLDPFRTYQEIAFSLAGEFNATWVPFQEALNNALLSAPATYWTADGVHPSIPGCELMAEAWLKAIS